MKTVSLGLVGLTVGLVGCGGTGNDSLGPGVRVLNANSTAAEVSVTSGTTTIASPLPYATESGNTRTPYTILPSGTNTVTFLNGTTPIASGSVNINSTEDVNVIALPGQSNPLVLEDDTSQLTDDEVRFVNASSTVPSADIILTPVGGAALPTLTVASGGVNPVQPALPGFLYESLTPGTYQLEVFATGQEAQAPLINEQVQLIAIRRWTFVLVDPAQGQLTPQLVQVQDSQLLNPN